MALRIVVRDADGDIVRTLVDANELEAGGFLSARRRFGDLRHGDQGQSLEAEHTMALLVGDVAKMVHPELKKKAPAKRQQATPKKKKATVAAKKPVVKKKQEEEEEEEEAAEEEAAEAAEEPVEKRQKTEEAAEEEAPAPVVTAEKKKQKVASFFGTAKLETPAQQQKGRLQKKKKKIVESSDEEEEAGKVEEEEEEWDMGAAAEESEEEDEASSAEEEVPETRPEGAVSRGWSAISESTLVPSDAQGDEWSAMASDEVCPPCTEMVVVEALGVKQLAEKFGDQGLVTLESPKFCLSTERVAKVLKVLTTLYKSKLQEAKDDGLVKSGSRLKKGHEEDLEGFNQRPGGRVDMDNIDEPGLPQDEDWPWESFVRKVLGPDFSRNGIGCVVSRPGDTNQNWHIDGVHLDSEVHQSADRLIVFCPLTDLNAATGATEFVPKSHFKSRKGPMFHKVSAMPRAKHFLHAGTPLAMDYRLWHRGTKNTSDRDRYLMYVVYQTRKGKDELEETGGDKAKYRKNFAS